MPAVTRLPRRPARAPHRKATQAGAPRRVRPSPGSSGGPQMTITVTEAGLCLADPAAYTDEDRLHEALTLLRRQAPVHRVEADRYDPFWAVTRHADVMEIERNNALFINAPRPLLTTAAIDAVNRQREAEGTALRPLTHTDDPQHRVVRAIGADWFRPRAMRALEVRIAELAKRYVDRMADLAGEGDFAAQVAVHYPLYVILSLLGLPESDFQRMLTLTQELFGGGDEERRRGATPEELLEPLLDFFAYFQRITDARPAVPPGVVHRQRPGGRRVPVGFRRRLLLRHRRHGRPRHDQLHHRRRPAR